MKLFCIAFAWTIILTACSKENSTREISKEEKAIIGTWIGTEIVGTGKNSVPVIINLITEFNRNYTYYSKVIGSIHILKITGTRSEESGIWKIEGKSIKLQPKNCQEIINVETGGYDTVTCNEKHGIEIKITDNLYEFEKTIDGNATTFLMARYK